MAPPFDTLLDAIAERSAVMRSVATDLEARVPGCPDWSVRDLLVHVGQVQLSWAAKVHALGAEAPGVEEVPTGDPLAWSEASTGILVDALRDVGPDAPCWTWWQDSPAPSTSGAVARHQVQEAAVHAYDAQSATGAARDLPVDVAVDAVDEFLVVSLGAMEAWQPWPHPPERVEVVAVEGPRWTVGLGAVVDDAGRPDATMTASASDLVLAFYSRIPLQRIDVEGDRDVVERLLAWASASTD